MWHRDAFRAAKKPAAGRPQALGALGRFRGVRGVGAGARRLGFLDRATTVGRPPVDTRAAALAGSAARSAGGAAIGPARGLAVLGFARARAPGRARERG